MAGRLLEHRVAQQAATWRAGIDDKCVEGGRLLQRLGRFQVDDLIAEAVEGLGHLAGQVVFLNQQADAPVTIVVADAGVQLLGLGFSLLIALQ